MDLRQDSPAADPTSAHGPLAGIRALEVGTLIAGPFAGRFLGDFGADVIKIEAPGKPDPLRDWGVARDGDRALWWPIQSRNKRLVTLDLKTGRDLFLDLVRTSDVVIENFRPGTLERWGLGYDVLAEVNPQLVLARVSCYGQTGPYASRPGFVSIAEAVSGMRHLNGFPDQPPPRTGISIGDSLGGVFALIGILAALYNRDARGGRGQVVDVALTESCMAMLDSVIPEYDRTGAVRGPCGTGMEGIAPSNIFRSSDGRWVVIAANKDTLFPRLCAAMGQPGLAVDPRFATHVARGEHQSEIEAIVAAWAAGYDADELERTLTDAGVACGPVNTVEDVVEHPQFRARESFAVHEDADLGPLLGPGVVPRFSETSGSVRWSGPWQAGAHNREVYCDLLDLSEDALAEYERAGVV